MYLYFSNKFYQPINSCNTASKQYAFTPEAIGKDAYSGSERLLEDTLMNHYDSNRNQRGLPEVVNIISHNGMQEAVLKLAEQFWNFLNSPIGNMVFSPVMGFYRSEI